MIQISEEKPAKPDLEKIEWPQSDPKTQLTYCRALSDHYSRRRSEQYTVGEFVEYDQNMSKCLNMFFEHEKCAEDFEAKSLFAAQVLTALPDFKRPFIVTTDASEDGIGAVLSQVGQDGKDRPVAFFSRGIDTPEIREELESMVKTRELELYAFLCATRKWRSFLYGQRFLWLTDHKPLL